MVLNAVLYHTISAYRRVGIGTHEQRRDVKDADRWRPGIQRELFKLWKAQVVHLRTGSRTMRRQSSSGRITQD